MKRLVLDTGPLVALLRKRDPVRAAYSNTLKAAEKNDAVAQTKERIRTLVSGEAPGSFVGRILGRELGLSTPGE